MDKRKAYVIRWAEMQTAEDLLRHISKNPSFAGAAAAMKLSGAAIPYTRKHSKAWAAANELKDRESGRCRYFARIPNPCMEIPLWDKPLPASRKPEKSSP